MDSELGHLWKETPLIFSTILSQIAKCRVYLKLENLHPSYSFKYRGISHFIVDAKRKLGPSLHVVAASGGNAGLAAACAARVLKLKCTVFIPDGVAPSTLNLLRGEGAEVIVGGLHYAEALKAAKRLVETEKQAVLVPAYEHPLVWEGHGSMIKELHQQLPTQPDAIFCSIGGGGLLGGLIVGCKAVGWQNVPLVGLETTGTDCFYLSMGLNSGRFNHEAKVLPPDVDLVRDDDEGVAMAHFNRFSSKASGSLGASEPSPRVLRMALERPGGVKTVSIPDELAMEALVRFADDHKLLVELACSTTLTPAYYPTFLEKLLGKSEEEKERIVVFIVCGGFKVDSQTVEECKNTLQVAGRGQWTVRCDDGELFRFDNE